MIKTLDYYNKNADDFIQGTISVDFVVTQDKFIERLESGAYGHVLLSCICRKTN